MKGLIIFSNGMEDSEALSTTALLRRAGLQIHSATIEPERVVKTGYGQTVIADFDLNLIDMDGYDFLIIPGGGYVSKIIDHDVVITEAIKRFNNQGKLIGAICAAPRFLGRLGLLNGKEYTAFPGSQKDAPNGHYMGNQKSYVFDNIVTARSAGAVIDFVYALVTKLLNEQQAKSLLENIIY